MNILILSVGTRNKIIQYFKRNISGNVVAADMHAYAPALYEADSYYIVPKISDPDYIDILIGICKKEKINAILSLIDPELSLLADNIDTFKENDVMVIGSSYELCEMSLDKIKMHSWLMNHNYKCAKSYDNIDSFYRDFNMGTINFPVIVKPVRGSASLAINLVKDEESLNCIWKKSEGMMIQEYLNGREIGADVYVDIISGEVISVFTKEKILMRAGETDKAVSFKDKKLFDLIERFVSEAGYRGEIDIDLFESDGEYYILEVNPRFGGGYPHAYECGCNHIKLIENNINGIVNRKDIGSYEDGIYMMKYSEIITGRL